MITWINFLHLYQPPTQTRGSVDRIVRESYALIPELLKRYSKLRLTLNISGSLLELLEDYGYQSLLVEYRELAVAGRIEFVGSAMYHPILALLPEAEVRRQMALHTEISQRIFGSVYQPKGFFIPEMAYGRAVADTVRSLGFQWIILDDVHFPSGKPDPSIHYQIGDSGLTALFRNRALSKTFPPEYVYEHRRDLDGQIVITAHDGELYGHWHSDDRGYYERAFAHPDIAFLTVSEYLGMLGKTESIEPRHASWESSEEEIAQHEPYALWDARGNAIHRELWQFVRYVLDAVNARAEDDNFVSARRHADRGLASCAWWWATGAKLGAFGPVSWNPTEIEKGARELLLSLRSIEVMPLETRLAAEAMYARLSRRIWETHWKTGASVSSP